MPKVVKQKAVKKTPRKTRKKSVRGGVLSRIKPIEMHDSKLNLSLYGRSGSGKTTLACTFPKPLLLIGTEDGTQSVYNIKGVDFVRVDTTDLYQVSDAMGDDSSFTAAGAGYDKQRAINSLHRLFLGWVKLS